MSNRIFKFSKTNNEETLEMSQLAQLQEQITAANAQLSEFTSVKEALASVQSVLGEKEAALAEALGKVAQLEEVAVATKLNARKEKLAAVMASDKVDSVSAALASLDDEAFSVVLAGYGLQKQQLEASDLMNEIGDQGSEVETPTQASGDDLTLKMAQAKYKKEGK